MALTDYDKAYTTAILNAGLALDIVHDGGTCSVWDGSQYTHKKGAYQPTAGRAFIEIATFIGGIAALTLNDSDEIAGLFQAIVNWPVDYSSVQAKEKADEILALLSIGAQLTYNSRVAEITKASRENAVSNPAYFRLMVRANFISYTQR